MADTLVVSDQDLLNAADVRNVFSNWVGIPIEETSKLSKINGYGSCGDWWIFALVITYRKFRWGKYSSIMLCRSAYDALMKKAKEWEFPLLVVGTLDGQVHVFDLALLDHNNLDWREDDGRKWNLRPNVSTEKEPGIRIPNHRFLRIR